jgi:hypothetical protein
MLTMKKKSEDPPAKGIQDLELEGVAITVSIPQLCGVLDALRSALNSVPFAYTR